MDAPPAIQDTIAALYVSDILQQNNGDITKIPLVWYTGNPQGEISQKALALNKGFTPTQYQSKWLQTLGQFIS